jgi:hypothetical protein
MRSMKARKIADREERMKEKGRIRKEEARGARNYEGGR